MRTTPTAATAPGPMISILTNLAWKKNRKFEKNSYRWRVFWPSAASSSSNYSCLVQQQLLLTVPAGRSRCFWSSTAAAGCPLWWSQQCCQLPTDSSSSLQLLLLHWHRLLVTPKTRGWEADQMMAPSAELAAAKDETAVDTLLTHALQLAFGLKRRRLGQSPPSK